MNLLGEPDLIENKGSRLKPLTLKDQIGPDCLVCGTRLIVLSRRPEWCFCPACGTRSELTIPRRDTTEAEEQLVKHRPGVVRAPKGHVSPARRRPHNDGSAESSRSQQA